MYGLGHWLPERASVLVLRSGSIPRGILESLMQNGVSGGVQQL